MFGIEIFHKEEVHLKWGKGVSVCGLVYSGLEESTTTDFFVFYTWNKQTRVIKIGDHRLLPILFDNLRTILDF